MSGGKATNSPVSSASCSTSATSPAFQKHYFNSSKDLNGMFIDNDIAAIS